MNKRTRAGLLPKPSFAGMSLAAQAKNQLFLAIIPGMTEKEKAPGSSIENVEDDSKRKEANRRKLLPPLTPPYKERELYTCLPKLRTNTTADGGCELQVE